jgi:hypothetical protein
MTGGGGRLAPLVAIAACLLLTGCISRDIKNLEISQLQNELTAVQDETRFFETRPTLGNAYGGEIFLSSDVLNRFLAGMDDYAIPLEKPSGAHIVISQVRMEFSNGYPVLVIAAKALDKSKELEITLNIRADLVIATSTAPSELKVGFAIREIIPDFRFSFLHLCRTWFGISLLRIEAQHYVDSLPQISVPLAGNIPVDVNSPPTTTLTMGGASIQANSRFPHFSLSYKYSLIRAVSLKDGLHLYLNVERTS